MIETESQGRRRRTPGRGIEEYLQNDVPETLFENLCASAIGEPSKPELPEVQHLEVAPLRPRPEAPLASVLEIMPRPMIAGEVLKSASCPRAGPAALPGSPAVLPGRPAVLPGSPNTLPGSSPSLPGRSAVLPGHPAGWPVRPSAPVPGLERWRRTSWPPGYGPATWPLRKFYTTPGKAPFLPFPAGFLVRHWQEPRSEQEKARIDQRKKREKERNYMDEMLFA